MRKFIFIVILFSLFAVYYSTQNTEHTNNQNYIKNSAKNNIIQQAIFDVKKMVKNSTDFLIKPSIAEGESEDVIRALQNLTSDEEFKTWITTESRAMNLASNNTDIKQIQLKAQAQKLETKQIKILKEIAINSSLPINERILSAYLISLNPAEFSQQSLYDIAQTEVPDTGPILPHTESEIKRTQELAIRYMQIDELFQRAKTDSNALDKLKLLVDSASSEQVRSYAQKKLKELN